MNPQTWPQPQSNSTITPATLSTLQTHAHLLQLFHHRNKNQHHRNPWYRHFDIFRRQLRSLITEINGTLDVVTSVPIPPSNDKKIRSKSKSKESGSHAVLSRLQVMQEQRKALEGRKVRCGDLVGRRLRSWEEGYVAKWFDGFGQLVADPQFAAMGVFLLAVLGRVCACVGVGARRGVGRGVEVGEVVDEGLGGDAWDGIIREERGAALGQGEFDGVDLGTRVEREVSESEVEFGSMRYAVPISHPVSDRQLNPKDRNRASPEPAGKKKTTNPPSVTLSKTTESKAGKSKRPADEASAKISSSKIKKLKKSKGNAIDDLFSGLF